MVMAEIARPVGTPARLTSSSRPTASMPIAARRADSVSGGDGHIVDRRFILLLGHFRADRAEMLKHVVEVLHQRYTLADESVWPRAHLAGSLS